MALSERGLVLLPAKYGGEVTMSATELSSTAAMSRLSPQNSVSATVQGLTVSSSDRMGVENRS